MRSLVADRSLTAVAGPPAAWRDTPGITPLPADPMADRTAYLVVETLDITDNYISLALMGNSVANGALTFQTAAAGTSTLTARVDTAGGSVNAARSQSGLRPGRRVYAAWVRAAMTIVGLHGNTTSSDLLLAPGSGMTTADLTLRSPVGTCTPIAIVAYLAYHDQATRLAVMRWLAYRYGVTPPQT